MDKDKIRHDEILGITRPFPPNPKLGDKFRRLKKANPITHEPSETITYIFDGIRWVKEEEPKQ